LALRSLGHQRQLERIGDIVGTSAPVGLGSSAIGASFVASFIWKAVVAIP
jgi:hypothetical protein